MPSTTPASKPIRQIDSERQLLCVLHGAISQHRDLWLNSGILHGNINLDTIRIGDESQGSLVYPHESIQPDPTFQSVMTLSESVLNSTGMPPKDYLDDLESFYYVLAYITIACTGPNAYLPSSALAVWVSNPTSREAVLKKEAMLIRNGLDSADFESNWIQRLLFLPLLSKFHRVLQCHYLRKLELAGGDVNAKPGLTSGEDGERERREETALIYERVLGLFEYMIGAVERTDALQKRNAAEREEEDEEVDVSEPVRLERRARRRARAMQAWHREVKKISRKYHSKR
ncbi:hypothetical protein B0H34DRAFT_792067 [Crassisporium funariophilum]|nr:hypothetical protein B0H34DRAFT_792067 [Crassisporium funariophilum]